MKLEVMRGIECGVSVSAFLNFIKGVRYVLDY